MSEPPAAAQKAQLARCRYCAKHFNPSDVRGGFNNHVRNCPSNPKVKARRGVRKGPRTPSSSSADASESPRATPSAAEHSPPKKAAAPTLQNTTSAHPKRSFAALDSITGADEVQSDPVETPNARLTAASVLTSLSDDSASVPVLPNARLCRRFTVLIYENDPPPNKAGATAGRGRRNVS